MNREELKHSGIKGQKWGIRRFQNPDGSLTPEGKERYRKHLEKSAFGLVTKKGGSTRKTTMDRVESDPSFRKAVDSVKGTNYIKRVDMRNGVLGTEKEYEYLDKAVNKFIEKNKSKTDFDGEMVEVDMNKIFAMADKLMYKDIDKALSSTYKRDITDFDEAVKPFMDEVVNNITGGRRSRLFENTVRNKIIQTAASEYRNSQSMAHGYELAHSGTKGMHWGVRFYQYADGSLTPLGKLRYGSKTNFNNVQKAKRAAAYKKRMETAAKKKARTDAEIAKIKTTKSEREEAKKAEDAAKAEKAKEAEAAKAKEAETAKREPSELIKRNIEDLTNEELDILIDHQKKISELRAELNKNKEPDPRQIAIAEAKIQEEYLKYFPKEVSVSDKVKESIKNAAKEMLVPATINAGKKLASSLFGLDLSTADERLRAIRNDTEVLRAINENLKYQFALKSKTGESFYDQNSRSSNLRPEDVEVLNAIRDELLKTYR